MSLWSLIRVRAMYGKVVDLNHLFPDLSFRAGVIIRVSIFFFFPLEVNMEVALGSILSRQFISLAN